MPRDLISTKSRRELLYWLKSNCVLREIEHYFDDAGIAYDLAYTPPPAGQRATLVEQYYRTLDFAKPVDAARFLKVIENIRIDRSDCLGPDTSLGRSLVRDGVQFDGSKWVLPNSGLSAARLKDIAAVVDLPYLSNEIQRIHHSLEDDPAAAVGSSKELLETVCKTILDERSVKYANPDVMELVKLTLKTLQLLPDDVPDHARGRDIIANLLRNLAYIADAMAQLRNLYGTGHGKGGKTRSIGARHARLAVGASTTLATFLYDTHIDR